MNAVVVQAARAPSDDYSTNYHAGLATVQIAASHPGGTIAMSIFIIMHVFEFAFYTAGAVYGLLYDHRLLVIFLAVVAIYSIVSFIYPGAVDVRIRRKIMFASWTEPSEGSIHNKTEVRVDHALKYLEQ